MTASILALVCFIVGMVFAIIGGEYRNSTFWFFMTLILLTGIPQLLALR